MYNSWYTWRDGTCLASIQYFAMLLEATYYSSLRNSVSGKKTI